MSICIRLHAMHSGHWDRYDYYSWFERHIIYTMSLFFLPFSSCGNGFCSHCSCCHATKYRSYILSWLNAAIFSCLLYIVTEFLYIVILRMTTMLQEMMALFVVYFFRQHYVFFCYVCSMFAGILWQTDGVWNLLLISFVCHWCLDNFVDRNNNCVHNILCACSGWKRIFKIGDGKRGMPVTCPSLAQAFYMQFWSSSKFSTQWKAVLQRWSWEQPCVMWLD